MRFLICAALALIAESSAGAQTSDLSYSTPLAGNWVYSPTADGSEAVFNDAYSHPQLWIHCTKATRHVTISKPASAAAALMTVWTSSLSRAVPSSFDPATGRLSIDFAPFDPFLDAIASSRGRVGFSVGSETALVLPPWAEVGRVVEDCRV